MGERYREMPCDCGECNDCMQQKLNVKNINTQSHINTKGSESIDPKIIQEVAEDTSLDEKHLEAKQDKPKDQGDDAIKFTKDKGIAA